MRRPESATQLASESSQQRTGLRSPLRRYSAACRGSVASVKVMSGGLDGAMLAAIAAASRCAGV